MRRFYLTAIPCLALIYIEEAAAEAMPHAAQQGYPAGLSFLNYPGGETAQQGYPASLSFLSYPGRETGYPASLFPELPRKKDGAAGLPLLAFPS